jgi:hypothetical protein
MPKASDHLATGLRKMLYIGDSGTGKTTSLISLVKAGYILRIFDFDNLLDPLLMVCAGRSAPSSDNIEFMSFRDKMKMTEQGPIVDGMPRAYTGFLKALFKWEDGTNPQPSGPPST